MNTIEELESQPDLLSNHLITVIQDAKTKTMVNVLKNIGVDRTAVIVTKGDNENVLRASSNLQNVEVTDSSLLNVYDIVKCDKLVLTADAVKSIEEGYKA